MREGRESSVTEDLKFLVYASRWKEGAVPESGKYGEESGLRSGGGGWL